MALSSMRRAVTGEAKCMGTLASASGSVLCVGYSESSQASPVTVFSGSHWSCQADGVNSWVFFWAPKRQTSLSSCLVVTLML